MGAGRSRGTCRYAVDLETAPIATFCTDTNGTAHGTALASAGVLYSQRITAATCDARNPTTAGAPKWGTSFSNAPTA